MLWCQLFFYFLLNRFKKMGERKSLIYWSKVKSKTMVEKVERLRKKRWWWWWWSRQATIRENWTDGSPWKWKKCHSYSLQDHPTLPPSNGDLSAGWGFRSRPASRPNTPRTSIIPSPLYPFALFPDPSVALCNCCFFTKIKPTCGEVVRTNEGEPFRFCQTRKPINLKYFIFSVAFFFFKLLGRSF